MENVEYPEHQSELTISEKNLPELKKGELNGVI